MVKRFERTCQFCGRSFNHWRSHWNHEQKCRIEYPMIPGRNVLTTPEEPPEDFDDGPDFEQACDMMLERPKGPSWWEGK